MRFDPVAEAIGSVPVYPDQTSAIVWTPTISNDREVTSVPGTDTGQARAALVDPNGVQYIASVSDREEVWAAPMVRVGDLVAFGLYDQESVAMLVKSIMPSEDLSTRVTLVDATLACSSLTRERFRHTAVRSPRHQTFIIHCHPR